MFPSMSDLHMCEDTIGTEAYTKILERKAAIKQRFFPGTQWIFQQDNAKPHSANTDC